MHQIGQRVGNIRITGTLGRGGMGQVYVGFDETLRRKVALKAIHGRHRQSPEAKARFLREARMLSKLEHPNICRIYDYIQQDDAEFLVLELIEGKVLDAAVERGLEPRQRLEAAIQVAGVLAAAHGAGVVHRDLKPGNVMLTEDGVVKVLDFGLARLEEREAPAAGAEGFVDVREALAKPAAGDEDATLAFGLAVERDATLAGASAEDATLDFPGSGTAQDKTPELPGDAKDEDATLDLPSGAADDDATLSLPGGAPDGGPAVALWTEAGSVVGTPLYMSPEQARGEPATTASDMYSFGLLLQALFTGKPPYERGIKVAELLERARKGGTLPATGVSSDLRALIDRLKAVAPASRATAVEALERLEWIRDKPKRRARRLAAAAAVVALALGGLKYTLDLRRERSAAVAARAVAEQRREQAEDLIGFMLGDLRKKLEPVGRLEILDDVGAKAMEYFASVPKDELSEEELLRRSQALNQIGDVRRKQGNLGAAMDAFQQSLELARNLIERDSENTDWLKNFGSSCFWVGTVHWRRGELARAQEQFEAYLSVAEELLNHNPSSVDWRMEVVYAHDSLGRVLQARGEPRRALRHLQEGLEAVRELVASDARPEWKLELGSSHITVGAAKEALGDLDGASSHYEADLEIMAELIAQDPAHTGWQSRLAASHSYVGSILERRGKTQEAQKHYGFMIEIATELVSKDPANTHWRDLLANGHENIGRTLGAHGEDSAGLGHVRKALAIFREMAAEDPTKRRWRSQIAECRIVEGILLVSLGDLDGALAAAKAAQSIGEGLAAEDTQDHSSHRLLSESYLLLGRVLLDMGHHSQAEAAWSRAYDVIVPFARDSDDATFLAPLWRALLRLGRTSEAERVLARLRAQGYVNPQIEDTSGS